jgi:hypothetical protein
LALEFSAENAGVEFLGGKVMGVSLGGDQIIRLKILATEGDEQFLFVVPLTLSGAPI